MTDAVAVAVARGPGSAIDAAVVTGEDFGPTYREVGPDRRGVPAGIVSRGLAFVIDAMLLTVSLGVTAFAVRSVIEALGFEAGTLQDAYRFAAVLGGTVMVVLIYNTAMWGLVGKTAGMAVIGLRVVRPDGTPPGLVRSFLRALAFLPSAVMVLGFLWVVVDRRRRSWPDHIAGTYVVYDWRANPVDRGPSRLNEPLVPRW